jgi:flagellar biosynthesis protein FlhG
MHTMDNNDQAAGLRHMQKQKPVRVISVSSGKGGVGKTNVSVNLSVALSKMGLRVLLMDADLGLANVDIMLGLRPSYNLSHVLDGSRTLEEVMVKGPAGMRVIPAASGIQHMAELSPAENAGLIGAFGEIAGKIDVLIVDTAAGISDSVVTFSRAAQDVIVVVCDEPASITDAYALIKVLSTDYKVSRFRILANMAIDEKEGRVLFSKISAVTDRFLNVTLDFMGTVPYDPFLRKAIQKQKSVIEVFPRSASAKALSGIAQKIVRWPVGKVPSGHLQFFIERLVASGSHG